MKKLILLTMVVLFAVDCTFAQDRITTTSEVSRGTSLSGFARDFWFTMITNYVNQSGKYYQAYVASQQKTTVKIAIGKSTSQQFPINALQVLVFDIPLAWEMGGSGEVEDKGIHVWSDDADLTVSVLSRNPATSDGMTILPTPVLGKTYVVAAFASYAYLPGYELPSEFAIVANEDNTVVTIDPSTDLRQGTSTAVAYARHKKFTVTLNKGQAVQYMASAANGQMTGYDVTGTVLSSTKPIGVVAGVQCANIPAEAPYCDHICEMIMPVDQWDTRYASMPFINRKGGDTFLMIARDSNTTISRTSVSGKKTVAVLHKYEHYFRHDVDEASLWESDKPFLLVQYCNGTDYPEVGANNGIGDPLMVNVPGIHQYDTTILFLTPKIRTSETQFRNFVNIIVHKNALNSTYFDGFPISFPHFSAGDFEIFRANDIKPGAHMVESDSGVGVYLYGYGSYDAYGWSGMRGGLTGSKDPSSDTSAPIVISDLEQCYSTDIKLAESDASGVGELELSVLQTNNSLIESIAKTGPKGEVIDYKFVVIDSSRSASAVIAIMDAAGNRRTVTHSYTPDLPTLADSMQVQTAVGDFTEFSVPITGSANTPLTNVTASLAKGKEFLILSAPATIAAGGTGAIKIRSYQPTIDPCSDTLLITAECWRQAVRLKTSPVPLSAFIIRDTLIDFGLVVVGNKRTRADFVVSRGTEPFTIDSIVLLSGTDVSVVSAALPVTVASKDSARFDITFEPLTDGELSGLIRIYTSIGTGDVHLAGRGSSQGKVDMDAEEDYMTISPNPARSRLLVTMKKHNIPSSANVIDMTGTVILSQVLGPADGNSFIIDLGDIPSGSYFLEVSAALETRRCKFVVSR